MAYLDDELAAEERHELEAHLAECAQCKSHVAQERADRSIVRRALAVGPAPDLLRAKIGKALDAEDRAEQKAQRKRWYQYALPGSAMVAAAAAIALFIGAQNTPQHSGRTQASASSLSHSAANLTRRQLPLEVQGASTGPWLRQNFAPQLEPPRFNNPGTDIVGARLLPGGIDGRDAAMVAYRVPLDGKEFVLTVLAVEGVRQGEWNEGRAVTLNNRVMHVLQAEDGNQMVSYVDSTGMGYLFLAPEISTEQLLKLVGQTTLVGEQ